VSLYMEMETDRPRSHGRNFDWERTEARAKRAAQSLGAVFRLLDAREDDEAERLLILIADRIKETA